MTSAHEDGAPSVEPAQGDDALESLVVECLDRIEEHGERAIEDICREHPQRAGALRAEIDRLRQMGLLGTDSGQSLAFPERLGEFRLIERLGGGGMGVVYAAEQVPLGRKVALKLIRPDQLFFPGARERFKREVEAVARLSHPSIVPIYTVGEEQGIPYFAMELVDGCTLSDVLRALRGEPCERLKGRDLAGAIARCVRANPDDQGAPPQATAAGVFDVSWTEACFRLVREVAEALEHAHSRGVLHRDVKPSNIAVTRSGRAILFDFGLAAMDRASRLTRSGSQPGSLPYMSPEQLRGERDIDQRADVYALGVTLYELLTLRPAFGSDVSELLRRAILSGEVKRVREVNPAVAWDAETVCATAMEYDRARRYPTARDLVRDLSNVLENRPIEARRPGSWLRLLRWSQRHPAASAGALMGLVLVVGLAVQQHFAIKRVEAEMKATALERDFANQVANFMVDLFRVSDPSEARGKPMTVREILDRGSQRIDTDLSDQPLVQARLMDIIGTVYKNLGVFDRAETLLREALAIRRRQLGNQHEDVAQTLNSLGELLYSRNDLAGAEPLYREALDILRARYPEGHQSVAISLCNLADVVRVKGDRRVAEGYYLEALKLRQKIFGEPSVEVANVLQSLGLDYLQLGEFTASEAHLRRCLSMFAERGIEDHPDLALAIDYLAELARHQYNRVEAKALYERALAMRLRLYGEHMLTSYTLEYLGELAVEDWDCASAVQPYRRVVAIRTIALAPCDSLTVRPTIELARCLARLQRFDECEQVLLACRTTCAQDSAANPKSLRALHSQLADLYEHWQKPEEAAKYKALAAGGEPK